MNLVIPLTIRNAVFADVLSAQHLPAGFALEAAQMPLTAQGQESLAIFDVSTTAGTIAGTAEAARRRGRGANTALAEAVPPAEGDALPGRKGLFADGAHKAGGVVGLAQDRHHLPLHELTAVAAERAVEPLEVQRAEAVAAPHEEATLSQVAAAHFAGEALYVEVVGLDPQHLSSAGLSAFEALDDPLPHIGVAAILGV